MPSLSSGIWPDGSDGGGRIRWREQHEGNQAPPRLASAAVDLHHHLAQHKPEDGL
jgi:hypothetical protein